VPTVPSARKNTSNSHRPMIASLRQRTPPFVLSLLALGSPSRE
jgi:hypothetical protein